MSRKKTEKAILIVSCGRLRSGGTKFSQNDLFLGYEPAVVDRSSNITYQNIVITKPNYCKTLNPTTM